MDTNQAPFPFSNQEFQEEPAPAFCFHDGSTLSRAFFFEQVDALKQTLDQLAPHSRISFAGVAETPATLIALLACAQTQHVAVPFSPDFNTSQSTTIEADVVATHRLSYHPVSDFSITSLPSAERPPDPLFQKLAQLRHPGLVLFTSGTTGRAKAMLHDLIQLFDPYHGLSVSQSPLRTLLLMHLDHIGGVDVAMRSLARGGTICLPATRTPQAVGSAIASLRIQVLPATPTFLRLCWMQQIFTQYDCSSLRVIPYGAEIMPETLLGNLRKTLPGVRLHQTFGTSETGALPTVPDPSNDHYFQLSPNAGAFKVIDGELYIQSSSRTLGYLNTPDPTTVKSLLDDNWFATGDLADVQANGSIRILGRVQKLINVGGEKVNPEEIRARLLTLDGVEDAHAYGREHPIIGNVVAVEILPSSDAVNLNSSEWKRIIRKAMITDFPTWKIPAHVTVLKQSPATTLTDRLKRV